MKPLNNKIQLDIQPVKIGAIQSDSIPEYAKIVAVGADALWRCASWEGVKHNSTWDEDETDDSRIDPFLEEVRKQIVGKTLVFKAWAVDVITIGDDKKYFISADSDAILALMD